MIGIQSIAGFIPPNRTDNFNRRGSFDVDHKFIEQKIGVRQTSIKKKDQETSDLCCEAVKSLQRIHPLRLDDIDCMVVCTQNPDVKGLPQTSAIVHYKLGLQQDCATFDISLGCSGYVYSLSAIQSFMTVNDLKKGILLTCDPYSKVINIDDKSTAMLFGDAATATLLGENPIWAIGKAVFGTRGEDWQAIRVGSNGLLSMQGRTVFNFVATVIPENIKKTLQKNSLTIEEIDLFAMHQGSKFIIDILRKRLGVPAKIMAFVATEYGNTVSSSIPLILEKVTPNTRTILISGFGVGLSWGSLVLKKQREE